MLVYVIVVIVGKRCYNSKSSKQCQKKRLYCGQEAAQSDTIYILVPLGCPSLSHESENEISSDCLMIHFWKMFGEC
jgi:hypothetical protein